MPRPMRRCSGCQSSVTSPRGDPPPKRCISTQHAARLRTTLGPWSCFARQVGGWGLWICRRVESASALLESADRLAGSLESVLPAWPPDQEFWVNLGSARQSDPETPCTWCTHRIRGVCREAANALLRCTQLRGQSTPSPRSVS